MKNWLKIICVILIFAGVSVGLFLVCKKVGITNLDNLKQAIDASGKFGIIVYALIITSFLTLFCFVPLLNTSLVVLGITIFSPVENFLAIIISNFISSSILFFIGDKFGENFAKKFMGKKNFERVQSLIDTKSKIYIPLMYLVPGFPDEALCIMAGMTKIKYWYLILISLIYHSIEAVIIIFCGENYSIFTSLSPIEWFMFINLIVIDLFMLKKIEKFIRSKK